MSLASNIQSLATRVGTEMKNQNARLEALESAGSLDVSDLAARVTDLESADAAQDTLIAAAKTRADKGVSDAAAAASAASAAQATADTAKTTATTANTTANTLNKTTVPNIAARVTTLEDKVVSGSTSKEGLVQLDDTITSNSTTQAATANAVNTLRKSVANLGMPGTKTMYFSSLGADGYYTAPADGYFQVQGTGGENSWWIVADEQNRHVLSGNNYTLSQSFSVMMPIAAGKKMRIQSNNLTSINILFIYAIGAE